MKTGKVYLVGAGPGDPGLITLKGRECLARADVIIYDHLLDEKLLEPAPPGAERIYAGKSGARHTKEQAEINRLLVEKAREGKTVVRLKGGDPFVFGRGGEEAEALAESGISFEVVPGVSSAVAVPAYAGIPVTQRGLASSLAIITGHEDPGKKSPAIAWEKLATGADTLVFLMGMQNLPEIVSRLIENGRPPGTPVAVIKDGTRLEQQTVTGTLKNIAGRVKKSGLGAPAVIVVGEVVKLRERLRWFDSRPLWGKKVLVTRARAQASALSRLLAERGAVPIELPAIQIRPAADTRELDDAIAHLDRYQWIIFTSTNGVEAFFGRLSRLERDARALHGLRIGAIGPATAQALENRGISPDYSPAVYTSQGLVAGLYKTDVEGKHFLLPRADIADKELVGGLKRLGAEVHEIAVYRTVPEKASLKRAVELIESARIDVITFTSSSTVANLAKALGTATAEANRAKIACIGPKTRDTAERLGFRVDILAEEASIPGLVAAIEEYFGGKS